MVEMVQLFVFPVNLKEAFDLYLLISQSCTYFTEDNWFHTVVSLSFLYVINVWILPV